MSAGVHSRMSLLRVAVVMMMIHLRIRVGMELAYAAGGEEYYRDASEPPCDGYACREARDYKKN